MTERLTAPTDVNDQDLTDGTDQDLTGGTDQDLTDRDFDYGVGVELKAAMQRARRQVAAEIREFAASESDLTPAAERAYEEAARVAEGEAEQSADAGPATKIVRRRGR